MVTPHVNIWLDMDPITVRTCFASVASLIQLSINIPAEVVKLNDNTRLMYTEHTIQSVKNCFHSNEN